MDESGKAMWTSKSAMKQTRAKVLRMLDEGVPYDAILSELGLEGLKQKFLASKKEVRRTIAPIFLKLHVGSVPYLLSILRESGDQWVRKNACEILLEIGSVAINFILDALNRGQFETESMIDVLRVLGDMRAEKPTKSLVNTLQAYLRHEDPRIREEALRVCGKVMGARGEKTYFGFLNDPDLYVRKRAIRCLGRMRSKKALGVFRDMLVELRESHTAEEQQLEATLFGALWANGDIRWPGGGTLEDFLLETLNRRLMLRKFDFMRKRKNPLSEEAVFAICETLGKVGSLKSFSILRKLGSQRHTVYGRKALEAIRRIEETNHGGTIGATPRTSH
jgi:HEAT repeat protein